MFEKCEFCEKQDFEIVNFVKNEDFESVNFESVNLVNYAKTEIL